MLARTRFFVWGIRCRDSAHVRRKKSAQGLSPPTQKVKKTYTNLHMAPNQQQTRVGGGIVWAACHGARSTRRGATALACAPGTHDEPRGTTYASLFANE